MDQIMGAANLYPDAPRMVTFWAGTLPSVMLYSAELAEAIISNPAHLNKGMFYDLLRPWLGYGLLTRSVGFYFFLKFAFGKMAPFSLIH